MTISNLGTNTAYTATPSIAFTSAVAVSAGTLVIVFVQDGSTTFVGANVVDSKSNAYTLGASSPSAGGVSTFIFYSFITTPLTTSDTVTYNAGSGYTTNTLSIAGISATGYGSADNGSTAVANTFGTTWGVTSAGSAAVANELYVGWVAIGGGGSPTQTSTWTTLNTPASWMMSAYFINTGTAAQTFNGTTAAAQSSTAVMAFQPSGGGGGGGGSFLLSSTSLIFM